TARRIFDHQSKETFATWGNSGIVPYARLVPDPAGGEEPAHGVRERLGCRASPPSPPSEKATACRYEAWEASTDDRAGDGMRPLGMWLHHDCARKVDKVA